MIRLLALTLALSFGLSAFAAPGDPVDFYDTSLMPKGIYKGLRLDTTEVRPTVLLDNTIYGALNDTPLTHYLVGNFYHNGQFHIAKIPWVGVDHGIFIRVKFAPMAYHSMVRYHMKDDSPIELIAPIPTPLQIATGELPQRYAKPILMQDGLTSSEATFLLPGQKLDGKLIEPQNFNLWDGMWEKYAFTSRLTSIDARAKKYMDEGAQGNWRPMEQTLLNYSGEEMSNYLRTYIFNSAEMAQSSMYNTVCRQCTIHQVQMLDKAVPILGRDRPVPSKAISKLWDLMMPLDAVVPTFTPFGLMMRGDIDGPAQLTRAGLTYPGRLLNLEKDPSVANAFIKGPSCEARFLIK